jgi:hypothetical protein
MAPTTNSLDVVANPNRFFIDSHANSRLKYKQVLVSQFEQNQPTQLPINLRNTSEIIIKRRLENEHQNIT